MARVRSAILIALFLAFFFCTAQIISATKADDADVELDDHEKSLLEDPETETSSEDDHGDLSSASSFDEGNEDLENLEDEEEPGMLAIDDKDVAVLTSANLSDFVKTNQFAVVEFYAPWCGHCQQFAPEYAAAATELKGEVPVAKIDVSEEYELAQQYQVQGFPTVYLFVNGSYKTFSGDRTKDGLVSWVKKKLGPSVANLTTTKDAETLLFSGSTAVVGLFDSLEGPENDEFEAVSKFEDEVLFYQTTSERVAAALGIDIKSKRPALVLLKKEAEKVSYYDGDFNKDAISEFVLANKLPLITSFTRETAHKIFDSVIKKHILCFLSPEDYEKYKDNIQEAAKSLKGKLIFVHVDTEDADAGKQVMEYFGISEAPKIMAFLALEEAKKFILEGEMTADNIKAFGEDFVADKLKPFYKSEPIPEKNDGDVKVVVGKNFDEIVLDESKDVLLEIYAPWCGHCQALEPIYNKLGKHLREVESLVIAKMDGTLNEHPRAKSDGYPTILFFPAGNKSFDPMTVESERTVKALYKFLKKNAAVPFTLPKKAKAESPAPTTTEKEEAPVEKPKDAEQAKDEL